MNKLLLLFLALLLNTFLIAQCPCGFITDDNNLVINGDFSNGNTGFASHYKCYRRHSYRDGPMLPEAMYGIVYNPTYIHWGFDDCLDHSGHGSMMVVNGNPMINKIIWKQNIRIKKNTTYFFSCWIASAIKLEPAKLQFAINGKPVGEPIVASAKTCEWNQFFINWESGNAEEVSISIVNKNVAKYGNDFILDDITFYECITPNFEQQSDNINAGDTLELRKIYFESGKSLIKEDSFEQLELLVQILTNSSTMEIEISGHTDSLGEDLNNLKLSKDRAMAIREYLINKGISMDRMKISGYGETIPIASNNTMEGRQKNRRVEIVILKQ